MPNITPFNSGDSMPDFYILGKHARMSHRKTAKYITVSQQSVSQWVVRYKEQNPEKAESLSLYGFDGDTLNEIVGYYATSKSVKKEVNTHCVELLIISSKKGFQAHIDEMAGIVPESENSVQGLTQDQFGILMSTLNEMKDELAQTKVRLTQEEKDKEHYLGIAYGLYPAQERMNRVAPTFEKFDRLEETLKEVGKLISKQGYAQTFPLSDFAKGLNLRHGEKINVSRNVCSWYNLNSSLGVAEIDTWFGGKKCFPLYLKPLIDLAIELELKKRGRK